LDYLKLLVNILVFIHHFWTKIRDHDNPPPWYQAFREYYAPVVESWLMQSATFASGFVYSAEFSTLRAKNLLKFYAGYFLVSVSGLQSIALKSRLGPLAEDSLDAQSTHA